MPIRNPGNFPFSIKHWNNSYLLWCSVFSCWTCSTVPVDFELERIIMSSVTFMWIVMISISANYCIIAKIIIFTFVTRGFDAKIFRCSLSKSGFSKIETINCLLPYCSLFLGYNRITKFLNPRLNTKVLPGGVSCSSGSVYSLLT